MIRIRQEYLTLNKGDLIIFRKRHIVRLAVSNQNVRRAGSFMTNQYMNTLYHDLLSNSPQTVTIDIPADMGTGQISQIVTKQGAVVSDWRMNYFSDVNVQGVNSEGYIQLLFCLNDGVTWNIAGDRQSASIQKGESCIYRGHGKTEYLCYSGKSEFLFKNVKIPVSYFHKILNDYFESSEMDAYERKLLTGISKISITPYMEHIFAELKDFANIVVAWDIFFSKARFLNSCPYI